MLINFLGRLILQVGLYCRSASIVLINFLGLYYIIIHRIYRIAKYIYSTTSFISLLIYRVHSVFFISNTVKSQIVEEFPTFPSCCLEVLLSFLKILFEKWYFFGIFCCFPVLNPKSCTFVA